MYRTISAIAALALVTLAGTTASAQLLNQPTKGKSFKTNIMVAYSECTVSDTVTGAEVLPACSNPTRVDPACGFAEAKGQGKLQWKAGKKTGAISVRAKLNKLAAQCEGDLITFDFVVRRSGSYCTGALGLPGHCTMMDFTQEVASCTVVESKCKAKEDFFLRGGAEQGQTEILDVIITNVSNGKRGFRVGTINGKIVR